MKDKDRERQSLEIFVANDLKWAAKEIETLRCSLAEEIASNHELQERCELAEAWAQQLFDKKAKEDLPGYRELGAKCATLETRAETAEARVENLAYYLRIYDHAHDSGNSVPGNIVTEARAAMKGLAEP